MLLNARGAISTTILLVLLGIGGGAGIFKVFTRMTGGDQIKKLEKALEKCERDGKRDEYYKKWEKCEDKQLDARSRVKDQSIDYKDKVKKIEREAKKKIKKCKKDKKKDVEKWKKKFKDIKKKRNCVHLEEHEKALQEAKKALKKEEERPWYKKLRNW